MPQPRRSKTGKLSNLVWFSKLHRDKILGGTILAIDPSSGSAQSMPGYALFKAGILTDSGIIHLQAGAHLATRLSDLHTTLVADFLAREKPDIIVIENIPMISFGRNRLNSRAMLPLQRSIGVIMAVFGHLPFMEMPIATWKKFTGADYIKGDEADAVHIGQALIKSTQAYLLKEVIVPEGGRTKSVLRKPRSKSTAARSKSKV